MSRRGEITNAPLLIRSTLRAVFEARSARRSGGGIPYRGFAEFEAALDLVRSDPTLAGALGRAGRRYVERRYAWDRIIARYEDFLQRIGA